MRSVAGPASASSSVPASSTREHIPLKLVRGSDQACPDETHGVANCPLCGDHGQTAVWRGHLDVETALSLGVPPARTWVRCAGCSLVRVAQPVDSETLSSWRQHEQRAALVPPTAECFSLEIAEADQEIRKIREVGHGTRWQRRDSVSAVPRLLEVGSRDGGFLAAAAWRGFDAHGLEPDPRRAAWSARHTAASVETGGLGFTPPEEPFDVVVVREALDEAACLREALQNLSTCLDDEGLLVIFVDLLDHPAQRLQGEASPLWTLPARRVWFERQTLALALVRACLQPVRLDHVATHPGRVMVYARRDPR